MGNRDYVAVFLNGGKELLVRHLKADDEVDEDDDRKRGQRMDRWSLIEFSSRSATPSFARIFLDEFLSHVNWRATAHVVEDHNLNDNDCDISITIIVFTKMSSILNGDIVPLAVNDALGKSEQSLAIKSLPV